MKKLLTIGLIIVNIFLVQNAFADATEEPEETSAAASETCESLQSTKGYSTPDGYFDTDITEPLTGITAYITLDVDGECPNPTCEGVAKAYRNTYACWKSDDDHKEISVSVIEAAACESCTKTQAIQIIRAKSGSGLLVQYISAIYKWGAGLGGMVAVVIIIFSGIQISTSQGKDVEGPKNRIIQSLSGLAILFLSGLILYTINPTFFTA